MTAERRRNPLHPLKLSVDPAESSVDCAPAGRDEVDQEREILEPLASRSTQLSLHPFDLTGEPVEQRLHQHHSIGESPDAGNVSPFAARLRVLEFVNDLTDGVEQLLARSSDRIAAFEVPISALLHNLAADRSRARGVGMLRLRCRWVRLRSGLSPR